MTVNGYLTDFSLPELFQLFERGRKTGLLTITPTMIGPVGMPIEMVEPDVTPGAEGDSEPTEAMSRSLRCHYIWFYRGRIVASSTRLDQKELGLQLQSLGWVSERMALKLDQVYPRHRPLGTWLKSQGILQSEQLQKLFYRQVIRQVSQLLRLKGGRFQFYSKARLPFAEMTGISLPGSAVILQSLRRIQDWSSLVTRLPAASSALISCRPQGERLKLSASEWQVWEYTNGLLSLQSIADQVQRPILEVRKVAYRLILAGLAEERVQDDEDSTEFMTIQYALPPGRSRSVSIGESAVPFFQSLVGFIRSQANDALPQGQSMLNRISNSDFTSVTPPFTSLATLPDTAFPKSVPDPKFTGTQVPIGATNRLTTDRMTADRMTLESGKSNRANRDPRPTVPVTAPDDDVYGADSREPDFLSTV
jgi:hypothetical protein